jgi:hypothetical protein
MVVLDENLSADQRLLLRRWRIHFRVVDVEVGRTGIDDEDLIRLLRQLSMPTFFTLDRDFYRPEWAHSAYSLVWLDIRRTEAAQFIRRFMRHPEFDTSGKRTGLVARVHADGVTLWRSGKHSPQLVSWARQ